MLVPSRIREVRDAAAARIANWSPPCPSATQAEFVAETLGQHDAIDDLGRAGAAGKRNAEPFHACLPLLRQACHDRVSIGICHAIRARAKPDGIVKALRRPGAVSDRMLEQSDWALEAVRRRPRMWRDIDGTGH